jgi:hypothetical protein
MRSRTRLTGGAIQLAAAALLLLAAGPALAQSGGGVRAGVGASVGVAFDDPDAAQLTVELPIEFFHGFEIGPWMALGFADDYTRVSLTGNFRYRLDLVGQMERFHPLLQGGLGFTHLDHGHTDEASFFSNVGVGFEYDITKHIALTHDLMFNWSPSLPESNDFYVSWEILGVRYRF